MNGTGTGNLVTDTEPVLCATCTRHEHCSGPSLAVMIVTEEDRAFPLRRVLGAPVTAAVTATSGNQRVAEHSLGQRLIAARQRGRAGELAPVLVAITSWVSPGVTEQDG